MGRRHRLILHERAGDVSGGGGRCVKDIIELKREPRFDDLVVLMRLAYDGMHKHGACDAVLDFHIGGDSRLQHEMAKSYEAKETWVRNQLLALIETLADLGP